MQARFRDLLGDDAASPERRPAAWFIPGTSREWLLSGGPDDPAARAQLDQQFAALAARAAIAADCEPGRAASALPRVRGVLSPEAAGWLNALADALDAKHDPRYEPPAESQIAVDDEDGPPLPLEGGTLTDIVMLSVARCQELEAEAARTSFARNIKRLRLECGWSVEDTAEHVGLSRDAVLDHLAGAHPRPRALKAYADAFSRATKRTVTVEELTRQ